MKLFQRFFIFLVSHSIVSAILELEYSNPAFESEFYEEALNPELCRKHLEYISKNVILQSLFIDRGLRIPKTITKGNMVDFGSYHACLDIGEETDDSNIDGKYCMIDVPLGQNFKLPSLPEIPNWPDWSLLWPNLTDIYDEDLKRIQTADNQLATIRSLTGNERNYMRNDTAIDLSSISFKMGICLPKSCTTREALDKLYFNVSSIGFVFEEDYCRLPDDKPWTPADSIATTLLSLIGLITLMSTTYDIYHSKINKKDPKKANIYYQAFSIYNNTRRLLTFNEVPGSIHCIDGIRAFAMAWVILGHTFTSVAHIANRIDASIWMTSVKSLWIMAAPITVDTFFTLSGLLVVYTTAGKLTGVGLLKNLHFFYLNRLLRLFPILAFAMLLQVSVFHRIADGPDWRTVASQVNACRTYWWTNLLYIQNYTNGFNMCLSHTWYLTVDMHLHLISPLILYWVLSTKKRQAWIALTAGLIISLTASTVFIFTQKFHLLYSKDREESTRFMQQYYINTLTRAPPFFVGMIFGYILHLGRNRKMVLSKSQSTLLWVGTAILAATVIYTSYYAANYSGHDVIIDSLINSFIRPAWGVALGWLILACTHGYGGVINWILCLKELRLLSRVSYSMYIIHYPIVYVFAGAAIAPLYFNVVSWSYMFLSHFVTSFICGFIITVLVDSPASIFIKLLLNRAPKKTNEIKIPDIVETTTNDQKKRGLHFNA